MSNLEAKYLNTAKMSLKAKEPTTLLTAPIPIPIVQEIVRKNPLQVPERYVRSHEEIGKESYMPHLSSQIPVIDLSLLSDGNVEELSKLDIACKEWGFFQLVNHGVQKELQQRMKDAASMFFNLPIEEKKKYAMVSNDIEIEGYGHDHVVSEHQKLDWSDELLLNIYPIQSRKLSFWPRNPEGFKEILEAYSDEIKGVGDKLFSSVSVIMGMQKDVLFELHKDSYVHLSLVYYPPCNTPEKVVGLTPHSDGGTITLLIQHDDVCGLEIRHKGHWVPVTPLPDALIVNVGDVMEILSNGKYKSIEHRAMTNKKKERIAYAIIVGPNEEVEIEPLDNMIDAQNPKLYKKIKYGEYLKEYFKGRINGKTHIDVAKIKASEEAINV